MNKGKYNKYEEASQVSLSLICHKLLCLMFCFVMGKVAGAFQIEFSQGQYMLLMKIILPLMWIMGFWCYFSSSIQT